MPSEPPKQIFKPEQGMPLVPVGENGLRTLQLLDQAHGHVIPRPDGRRANCAGPEGCWTCHMERLVYESRNKFFVDQGLTIKPGDKVLLIAPEPLDLEHIKRQTRALEQRFPGTEFTIVSGFTGLRVATTQ